MPAIRIDCIQPSQPAKLGWFEQMQMQLQTPLFKQESIFRHPGMGMDTWSDPSLPSMIKPFANIMPRGEINETVAETLSDSDPVEAQGE